jgi:endonuclease/exonuclease/phosphatase family metal-dependent hydrolase
MRTTVEPREVGRGRVRMVALAAILGLLGALLAPAMALAKPPVQAQRPFQAMTYNVYLGTDLSPLFAITDPAELIQAAADAYQHVVDTDFNERGEAIARQIVEASPEVVGLQEVSLWQTAPLTDPSEMTTQYDFLAILLGQLAAKGHPYEAVSVNETFSASLPISTETLCLWTDRNVILVRDDHSSPNVITDNPMEGKYQATLPVQIGGQPLDVTRGWASADVKIRGRWFRLVTTHLEAYHAGIRYLQTLELMALTSASPYPVVLAGDLNWYPPGLRPEDAPAWLAISGAGFVDSWFEAEGIGPGYTASFGDDLNADPSALDNRVDYVLHNADGVLDAVVGTADVVGDRLEDRTLVRNWWPSDHAAAIVTLKFTKD